MFDPMAEMFGEMGDFGDISGWNDVTRGPVIDGPSSDVDPESCLTDFEVERQRADLEAIASQVETYAMAGEYVDALVEFADDIGAAMDSTRDAMPRLALGAFPEDIQDLNEALVDAAVMLEEAARALAGAVAKKYGVRA